MPKFKIQLADGTHRGSRGQRPHRQGARGHLDRVLLREPGGHVARPAPAYQRRHAHRTRGLVAGEGEGADRSTGRPPLARLGVLAPPSRTSRFRGTNRSR